MRAFATEDQFPLRHLTPPGPASLDKFNTVTEIPFSVVVLYCAVNNVSFSRQSARDERGYYFVHILCVFPGIAPHPVSPSRFFAVHLCSTVVFLNAIYYLSSYNIWNIIPVYSTRRLSLQTLPYLTREVIELFRIAICRVFQFVFKRNMNNKICVFLVAVLHHFFRVKQWL